MARPDVESGLCTGMGRETEAEMMVDTERNRRYITRKTRENGVILVLYNGASVGRARNEGSEIKLSSAH